LYAFGIVRWKVINKAPGLLGKNAFIDRIPNKIVTVEPGGAIAQGIANGAEPDNMPNGLPQDGKSNPDHKKQPWFKQSFNLAQCYRLAGNIKGKEAGMNVARVKAEALKIIDIGIGFYLAVALDGGIAKGEQKDIPGGMAAPEIKARAVTRCFEVNKPV